ncbi:MAG: deoxynucleoside kinase [Candidatus Marinimicrobia bacterium]|nr:deoxynucleoside kinase [Candidatus Neomarinimicrobiota bacterium]
MKSNPFVGVAGNIGVGKTTFTEIVAKHFGWREFYESVADNPYLDDFYRDMHRWSFNLQIYFLHHRFAGQVEIRESERGVIQDRTIYEDVEIFARNLHEMKFMTDRDWDTYVDLFNNMTQFLRKPDLIIYLRASTDTLLSRIRNRDRNFERDISPEYLHSLNISYDQWIRNCTDYAVLTIESDGFNIFEDKGRLDDILTQIQSALTP